MESNTFEHKFRVTVFGKYLEIVQYSEVQMRFQERQRKNTMHQLAEALEHRADQNRSRAVDNVYKLVMANHGAYGKCKTTFMTLTFAENVTDLRWANYEFTKFIQRLRYETKLDVQYVAVAEFQERGAIHYHLIIFNIPRGWTAARIEIVWGHGRLEWRKLYKARNAAAYITKYIVKAQDTLYKKNIRGYFTSRGLIRPQVVFTMSLDNIADWSRLHVLTEQQYETSYCGTIVKKTYVHH